MEIVTVKWFNKLKGYGGGLTKDGRKIFLHYTAIDRKKNEVVNLDTDQQVLCDIRKDDGRLIAYSILTDIQTKLFDR